MQIGLMHIKKFFKISPSVFVAKKQFRAYKNFKLLQNAISTSSFDLKNFIKPQTFTTTSFHLSKLNQQTFDSI